MNSSRTPGARGSCTCNFPNWAASDSSVNSLVSRPGPATITFAAAIALDAQEPRRERRHRLAQGLDGRWQRVGAIRSASRRVTAWPGRPHGLAQAGQRGLEFRLRPPAPLPDMRATTPERPVSMPSAYSAAVQFAASVEIRSTRCTRRACRISRACSRVEVETRAPQQRIRRRLERAHDGPEPSALDQPRAAAALLLLPAGLAHDRIEVARARHRDRVAERTARSWPGRPR